MNKQDKDKVREIANNYGSVTFIGPFSEKTYSESDCVKAILEMTAWKEQQMIEKAVEYINNTIGQGGWLNSCQINNFIEDFKNFMQNEM